MTDHAAHPRHVLDHLAHPRHAWEGLGDAFEALSERNYRLYFIGQCISASGPWMQAAAVSWLALDLTGSPLTMGTIASIQFVPVIPLSLAGGTLADRFPKRTLMLLFKVYEMLQSLAFGALVLSGALQLWHLYVLSASLGLSIALSQPATRAFTSELVPRDKLASGFALTTTVMTTSRFLGPTLAGAALASVGAGLCFLLNGLSYVGVLAALLAIRPAELQAAEANPSPRAGNGGVAEMLRFVWSSPNILFELVLLALIGAFGYNFSSVLLPLIARHDHVVGAMGLFAFGFAMVVGSLIGTVISGRSKTASRSLSVVSAAAFALFLLSLTLTTNFTVTVILLVALGTALMVFGVSANTSVQLLTPQPLRGRVMSLYMICYLGPPTIGASLTGILAEHWGVRTALVSEAGLIAVGLAVSLLFVHRRLSQAPSGSPS